MLRLNNRITKILELVKVLLDALEKDCAMLLEISARHRYHTLGERQRGDRDPVSRTNFNKIHASRFESVIVGETSGNEIFTTKHK